MAAETATWNHGRSWGGQGHGGRVDGGKKTELRGCWLQGVREKGSNKDNSQISTTGGTEKSVSSMRTSTWFGNHN